jgi:hypothetical protein
MTPMTRRTGALVLTAAILLSIVSAGLLLAASSGELEAVHAGSAPDPTRSTQVQASPAALLLKEDFGFGFPPAGWSVTTTNTAYTWVLGEDTYGPLDGDALVGEDPLKRTQNEWLKTPTLSFVGSYSQIFLTFHFKMSYSRSVAPDNVQNLEVRLSTNNGGTWPVVLWDETQVGVFPNYQWIAAQVNLSNRIGQSNLKLAFRATGVGGGPVEIDLVEITTYLCGDLTNDQILTSADVIFLVNYVFKGGPAASPPSAADMNNNGIVNSSDIVYLVNHVFKAGPPPPCP